MPAALSVASPEETRLGTWGPDSEKFVFYAASTKQYLFQTVPGTDRLFRLTGPGSPNPDLENTTVGRWSPSGDRILDAIEAGTPRGVSIMDADGPNDRRVVDDGGGRPGFRAVEDRVRELGRARGRFYAQGAKRRREHGRQ